MADPTAGEAILTIAARERAGRIKANSVIASARAWYAGVQKSYAKQK